VRLTGDGLVAESFVTAFEFHFVGGAMNEDLVTLTTRDGAMDVTVVCPDGQGPFPAVVVAQEAFGVNDHIRDVCRRFVREGYVALAPELFHRSGRGVKVAYADLPSVFTHLAALTNEGLEHDLRACFDHLCRRPEVVGTRIGLVGFCMGGFTAFLAACRLDPAATVSFYGGGIVRPRVQSKLNPLLGEAAGISSPILCLFGAEDQGIPPADVEAVRQALDTLEVPHEVVVYPGAGHGFFCDQRPVFNRDAAADAWRRTLSLFGRYLREER
jgi:carboxymethylenebutenolidase